MSKFVTLHGFGNWANLNGGSGINGNLNFDIVNGTTEPEDPTENMIWIDTDVEITKWAFSNKNPYISSVSILVRAEHTINSNSTNITIIDNSDNSVIATQTIIGTTNYSVFTDQVVSFVTKNGFNGTLTCSVRQSTTPFFTGSVIINDVDCGTVEFGTGTNSSYAWSGEQNVTYETNANIEEGAVWIQTSTHSRAEFNALQENSIQVFPVFAKQYISGEWVVKTAQTYQNDTWVDWLYYMFKKGSGFTEGFTGFENCAYSWGTQTYTNDLITLAQYEDDGYTGGIAAVAKEPVDLTNYNTAYFDIEEITCWGASGYSSDGYLGFANATDRLTRGHAMTAKTQWHTWSGSNGSVSDTVFAVDISSLTGEYYAKCSYACSDSDETHCTFKIRNIYFK